MATTPYFIPSPNTTPTLLDQRAMLETKAPRKFLGARPEATVYPKVG